ncbi:MAG: hypothetical protein IPN58_17410 [Anaerolineales bacterium]|nr:hypothetical protein [Anaerolineales bacterium]
MKVRAANGFQLVLAALRPKLRVVGLQGQQAIHVARKRGRGRGLVAGTQGRRAQLEHGRPATLGRPGLDQRAQHVVFGHDRVRRVALVGAPATWALGQGVDGREVLVDGHVRDLRAPAGMSGAGLKVDAEGGLQVAGVRPALGRARAPNEHGEVRPLLLLVLLCPRDPARDPVGRLVALQQVRDPRRERLDPLGGGEHRLGDALSSAGTGEDATGPNHRRNVGFGGVGALGHAEV